jgi:uncharacterized protein
VLSYYAAVDAGDLTALLTLFHQDAEYQRGGYRTLYGIDQLRHFYSDVRIIADGRHTVRALVVEDDQVGVRGEFHGRSRAGEPLAIEWADFFTVIDGLIRTRRTYFMAPGV